MNNCERRSIQFWNKLTVVGDGEDSKTEFKKKIQISRVINKENIPLTTKAAFKKEKEVENPCQGDFYIKEPLRK